MKISETPHVIFKPQVSFSSNFALLFNFSSKNIYFAQKVRIKVKSFLEFEVLESKFVKILMSILKRQVIPT